MRTTRHSYYLILLSVGLPVCVINSLTVSLLGRNTLGDNDQGSATIVEFDSLDIEQDTDSKPSDKVAALMKFLKEKLEDGDYSKAAEFLGLKSDLSNEDLLEQITLLLKKKKEDEEEEEEKEKKGLASYKDFMSKCMKEGKTLKECADDWKKERPKSQEALEMASYKDFMQKCMKGGKPLKECADEWKKKYPEPKKEEIAEVEELAAELAKKKDEDEYPKDEYPEPVKKKMEEMEDRIKTLEEQKRAVEINAEIQELVSQRHLAPVQKDPVFKLSNAMDDEMREDFLNLFRTTQKFKVDEDVGLVRSAKPGEQWEIDEETRTRIMKEHGLNDLIADKGVKPKNG